MVKRIASRIVNTIAIISWTAIVMVLGFIVMAIASSIYGSLHITH